MTKICAIIPARGGSKSVPKKSIQNLGGHPLLAYSVALAKTSLLCDRVVVSTDSEEIAEVAKHYGAEVPFIRPSEFARDDSTDLEFVLHALNWFETNEGEIPDYLVHLRPTTPLRKPELVDKGIRMLLNKPEATSLRSGHRAPESPFKWFLLTSEGLFRGLRSEFSNDFINRPRQEFPDVFIPDGYVDVLNSSFIMSTRQMYGKQMMGFVSPFCHEVDTPEDFHFLDFELKRDGSPLLDYLNKLTGISISD